MEEKLKLIKEKVEPEMNKINIIFVSIDFVKENNYNFLKIVLDKVNGMDTDTIVKATNIINPILDKLDLFKDSYILDVSSKGSD